MRPLAPSVARGRSRRIHRGGTEVRHGQCRVPKARRYVERALWSIGGGVLALPKKIENHADLSGGTNRPDRKPAGRSPDGVSFNLGPVGGRNSRAEPSLWKPEISVASGQV